MIKPSQANLKDDYAQYINRASQLIYAPQMRDAIIKMLQSGRPVEQVAAATVMVMQRIDAAARTTGNEIQDAVRIAAANEIVGLIIEIGEVAKILDKLDADLKELALSATVQKYIDEEIRSGRMNRQKVAIAIQRDIRNMPPKARRAMLDSMKRVQQTGRKYGGSSPVEQPTEQSAPGLLATGGAQ